MQYVNHQKRNNWVGTILGEHYSTDLFTFDLLLSLNVKHYKQFGECSLVNYGIMNGLEGSWFKHPLDAWPYFGTQLCYDAPGEPARGNPEVPVAEKYLELCLW